MNKQSLKTHSNSSSSSLLKESLKTHSNKKTSIIQSRNNSTNKNSTENNKPTNPNKSSATTQITNLNSLSRSNSTQSTGDSNQIITQKNLDLEQQKKINSDNNNNNDAIKTCMKEIFERKSVISNVNSIQKVYRENEENLKKEISTLLKDKNQTYQLGRNYSIISKKQYKYKKISYRDILNEVKISYPEQYKKVCIELERLHNLEFSETIELKTKYSTQKK